MRASRIASSWSPRAHFSRMDCSKMDKGVSCSRGDIDQADIAGNKGRPCACTRPPPLYLFLYTFLDLGKVYFPARCCWRWNPRIRWWSALLSIPTALASCGIQELPSNLSREMGTGKVYALDGLEGRWSGTVRSDNPFCGSSMGLMTIRGDKFAFDPFQSTTVIRGTISNHSRLQGNLSSPAGNKTSLYAAFDGSTEKNEATEQSITIIGTLTSGVCRWAVRLQRR